MCYGEQDENGVDLSLIRENLKLSPIERLRRGDRATTDMLRLRQHARENRSNSTGASGSGASEARR